MARLIAACAPGSTLSLCAPLLGPVFVLDGGWRMAPAQSAGGLEVAWAEAGHDDSGWRTVRLPCLHRATADHDTVWYRCRFTAEDVSRLMPATAPGRLLLRLGGSFYYTSAWLNGRLLGDHSGYFQPFGFDVSEAVQAGDNILAVRCRFPVEAGAFKRKTAVAGIFADWDCKPYPSTLFPNLPPPYEWTVPAGLWQPVSLHRAGPIAIEVFNVFPLLDEVRWPGRPDEPGAERAHLKLALRLRNLTADQQECRLTVSVAPHNFSAETSARQSWPIRLKANEVHETSLEMELPAPRLWSPWTHGEPWLYRAVARLGNCDGVAPDQMDDGAICQVFGVRRIEAETDGERWEWRLNGRRIFPKGSNYVSDFYLDNITPQGLRRDLTLARGANLDLLRVHAHIAPSEFYRLCDEAGLMVMCDFPLIWTYAQNLDADESARFRSCALDQVGDMVGLLGSRPSIVLWSMHNESPWTRDGGFLGGDLHQRRANQVLDEALAARARALDPTRPVAPASGLHDQHLYHGWYTGAWLDNRELQPAFPTEFGVQALPDLDSPFWTTVNTGWPVSADDPSWAYAGYQSIFWSSPGVGSPAQFESLADYVEESQAYQAFYVRHTIEQWRRRKFSPTGGYVHFLFTDCWPAITWSVLDFYRLPKAGYQALAEASRPVRLCFELEAGFAIEHGFRLVVPAGSWLAAGLHLVNDDYRLQGDATLRWWIEPRPAQGLAAFLRGRYSRLMAPTRRLPLPAAGDPARLVQRVRIRLARDGEYSLRTRVRLGRRIVDENRLDFRVGRPRASSRAPRRVPGFMVNRVYQAGSLRHSADGFTFHLRNPAMPVTLQRLTELRVDGERVETASIDLVLGGVVRQASSITPHAPLELPSGEGLSIVVRGRRLLPGRHELDIAVHVKGLGEISARLQDRLG